MQTTQSVWRWKVATYLFLAGAGAGAYILGILADYRGYFLPGKISITLGVPMVAIGTLFLLWDLGHPERFYWAFVKVRTSWISRGTWILTLFVILGVFHIALWVWPSTTLADNEGIRQGLGLAGVILAAATAFYTGVLIGVVGGRPFWNSPALPVLFLVSALSTGVGVAFLGTSIWQGWIEDAAQAAMNEPMVADFLEDMGAVDLGIIVVELLVVYFYLTLAFKRASESVSMLVTGRLAGLFWAGFAMPALAIPIVLEALSLNAGSLTAQMVLSSLAGVSLLGGGLLLRLAILLAGVRSPLVARVPFRVRPGA